MATLSEIFQQIFQDQEVFMEYMTALAQHREIAFFQQRGCPVTLSELKRFQQQWKPQPSQGPKPLVECPPFSEQDFFAALPQKSAFARQPGEENHSLHFID